MKKVIIMRGLPGSGKSTHAKDIVKNYDPDYGRVFSTDDYWYRPNGKYDFNAQLLGDAHEWNFERFSKFVIQAGEWCDSIAIVDNTNIKRRDFEKYTAFAKQHGFTVSEEVMTEWDVDTCAARNTHGVPREVIQRMKDTFES